MWLIKRLLKRNVQEETLLVSDAVPGTLSSPDIKESHNLPTKVEDFKREHIKLLRRLECHPVKENFSGIITIEVDIPKFIPILLDLGLVEIAPYEESLSLLKNDVLKMILKKSNLKVSGNKNELVNRISLNLDPLVVRSMDDYSDCYKITPKGQKTIKDFYAQYDEQQSDFFKNAVSLIENGNMAAAYQMICKRNAELPIPPGMGVNWKERYHKGIPPLQQAIYMEQLDKSIDKNTTAISIYSDISGESLEKIRALHEEQNHIQNFSQEKKILNTEREFASYKECGIDQYRFLATLDDRTCPTCGALDGKVFPVSKKKIGKNCPPMHDGCRCTTIAVVNGVTPKERRATNPITHKNELIPYITYSEWKNNFIKK